MSFVASEEIKREAMAECIRLSDYVLGTFGGKLDWTDESIEKVEELLDYFHQQAQNDKPTEAEVFAFAKGFGSYIGEVYRRNHGAEWGLVTLSGSTFPGLRSDSGIEFWPWGRAQQRIVEGPSNNVWHYYQTLVARGTVKITPTSSATTWWRRILGRS
ncbi:hypothetical protein J2W27_004501 [Variovorax boronicumulans]|uniref:hypothetical protein n=1 Tax=Variovorax boronicumulans TaxID=436515 RepID=UPI0027867D5F|nr:hypothetical protein [Variovorax boronicumulans]MDP9912375.1 hypothetical protein [Variovorax boronicumulans]